MMTSSAEQRQKQYREAEIIRAVVAHYLGVAEAKVTNWTPLGEQQAGIISELNRRLSKTPSPEAVAKSVDVASLISAYRDHC